MLRRTKDLLIDGAPIISLPAKEEITEYVVLSSQEEVIYNNVKLQAQEQVRNFLHSENKYRSMNLSLLLRLRQACCHPQLGTMNRKSSIIGEHPIGFVRDVEEQESTDTSRGGRGNQLNHLCEHNDSVAVLNHDDRESMISGSPDT